MSAPERGPAGEVDERVQIVEFPVDGVGKRVGAGSLSAAIIGEDCEVLCERFGQLWQLGLNPRKFPAASTRMTAGPAPTRSNAMDVPSLEVTLPISLLLIDTAFYEWFPA